MSCLEAGAPTAPGGHCFHQKMITARSFQIVTGESLPGARAQSLVRGPCAQWAGAPRPRCPCCHPGRPVAEAEAPRLSSCWRTGCLSWWASGLSPGPGPQQTPSWATPHLWGGRVLQTGLWDRRAQPTENPTCREKSQVE